MFRLAGLSVNLRTFLASAMAAIRQRDYLDVHSSGDPQCFRQSLLSFAERLSFERLTAVLVVDRPGAAKRVHEIGNVPQEYLERSQSADSGARDPVLQRLKVDGKPFLYDQSLYVGSGAGDLWEEQAAFGYKTGVSVALHTGSGVHFYLGLDRSKKLPANDLACARLMADIHLLATYAQETAVKVFEPTSPFVEPLTRLSTREREVLNWVKEGKSAWVIGEILGISEHTVEFHCTNARRKMGAATTHAAILRAIGLGLL